MCIQIIWDHSADGKRAAINLKHEHTADTNKISINLFVTQTQFLNMALDIKITNIEKAHYRPGWNAITCWVHLFSVSYLIQN